ncbi:ATP-binding protein [Streptomyces antibioticus]|uniref:ATP-binding protein n=1 Tax=Streptomyces antibioticus TaxID=1890 RepID=UPI0036D1F4AA
MSTTTSPRTAQYAVELPHTRQAPSIARHASEDWLTENEPVDPGHGDGVPDDRVADAVLVVSELVTNAVRHTQDPCLLTLTLEDGLLDIAVADHSEDLPDLHDARGDERGGLGMDVIRGLGGRIRLVPALGGKTVHVLLDATPDKGPGRAPGSDAAPNPRDRP